MKKKLRNKTGSSNRTGYRTLKLRLLIVLVIVGGTLLLGFDHFTKHHDVIVFVPVTFIIVSLVMIVMYTPIKIRHNGFEQSV